MDGYRPIEPLPDFEVQTNIPGAPPEWMMLRPDQLVVNEEYQRELSRPSIANIKRMAKEWHWPSYKAPSVARTDDPLIFEVVDGQHTAIAAATNGNVPYLPCLLMAATTLEEKAAGFIGINTAKTHLTEAQIFNAKVAKKDPWAIAVYLAMTHAGCELVPFPPPARLWKPGQTIAIGTLLKLAERRGEARLETILSIAVGCGAAPVSACLIRALDIALPLAVTSQMQEHVTMVLKGQNPKRLEMIASAQTQARGRVFETFADAITIVAKLPERRMGYPKKERRAQA